MDVPRCLDFPCKKTVGCSKMSQVGGDRGKLRTMGAFHRKLLRHQWISSTMPKIRCNKGRAKRGVAVSCRSLVRPARRQWLQTDGSRRSVLAVCFRNCGCNERRTRIRRRFDGVQRSPPAPVKHQSWRPNQRTKRVELRSCATYTCGMSTHLRRVSVEEYPSKKLREGVPRGSAKRVPARDRE